MDVIVVYADDLIRVRICAWDIRAFQSYVAVVVKRSQEHDLLIKKGSRDDVTFYGLTRTTVLVKHRLGGERAPSRRKHSTLQATAFRAM